MEDLTKSPIEKSENFYKPIRQCKNEDYERYGEKNYADDIE